MNKTLVERTDPQGSYEAQLPPELESVVAARRMLEAATHAWDIEDAVARDAALTISELVTNSVLHARTSVGVAVRRLGSGVRIEIWDGSSHLPVVRRGPARGPARQSLDDRPRSGPGGRHVGPVGVRTEPQWARSRGQRSGRAAASWRLPRRRPSRPSPHRHR